MIPTTMLMMQRAFSVDFPPDLGGILFERPHNNRKAGKVRKLFGYPNKICRHFSKDGQCRRVDGQHGRNRATYVSLADQD